jgi:hypothetical protein
MTGVLTATLGAGPALACGGLVGPGGTVKLARTTTLAAWHDGIEHYITSFEYAGGGAEFGSIVPLPGVPTKVEKGGEWTLQRLIRETQPQPEFAALDQAGGARAASAPAEVILEAKVDALDITVLKGGGKAVGDWAREHGFGLSPDAPEVLDFYAERSPIFMAAAFNPERAASRDQIVGQGTPVHLTIPTPNPWVPLRILGLGLTADDQIQADVYLLTDRRPAMLPMPTLDGPGTRLAHSAPATGTLLTDLRSDKGMDWLPATNMWLSWLQIDTTAGQLRNDLAIDLSGKRRPSRVAAGLANSEPVAAVDGRPIEAWPWALVALGLATVVTAGWATRRGLRGDRR